MKNTLLTSMDFPIVMGILNITPDSFFDGGRYTILENAIKRTGQMLYDGAGIIDVGAYSSRPDALHISQKEEEERLIPVLRELVREYPDAVFSVDTFRSDIARKAVDNGVRIINDISGGNLDPDMFRTIASLQVPYILMHMKGTPQTMQKMPVYKDVVQEVSVFFKNKLVLLEEMQIKDVILDVGFGFGKTLQQNYKLLKHLDVFTSFDKPVLVGLSRKSMLYKLLDITPQQALNATTVVNTFALEKGAKILRVHDVKEAVEVIKVYKSYIR